MAYPDPQTPVIDTFPTDAGPPPPGWTGNAGEDFLLVTGGKLANSVAGYGSAYYSLESGKNQEAYIDIDTMGASLSSWYFNICKDLVKDNRYILEFRRLSDGTHDRLRIYKRIAGVETQIGGDDLTQTFAAGDAILFGRAADVLYVCRRSAGVWTQVLTRTAVREVGGGLIDIAIPGTVWRFDNLGGGGLPITSIRPEFNRQAFPLILGDWRMQGTSRAGVGARRMGRRMGPSPIGGFERYIFPRLHPIYSLGGTDWEVPIDDTLSLADALQFDREMVLADTAALADSLSFDQQKVIADNLALADALAFARELFLTDTVGLSDSLTAERGLALAIDDTVSLADLLTTESGKGVSVNDTVSLADALVFDRGLVISDNVSLADALAKTFNMNLADSVAMADAITPAQGYNILIVDSAAVADFISPVLTPGGGPPPTTKRRLIYVRQGFFRRGTGRHIEP